MIDIIQSLTHDLLFIANTHNTFLKCCEWELSKLRKYCNCSNDAIAWWSLKGLYCITMHEYLEQWYSHDPMDNNIVLYNYAYSV